MRPCSLRIQTIVSNRTFTLSPAAYRLSTRQIGNPTGIGGSDGYPAPIGESPVRSNVAAAAKFRGALSQVEIQPRTNSVLLRVLPVSA
jgi:hypothetical protein